MAAVITAGKRLHVNTDRIQSTVTIHRKREHGEVFAFEVHWSRSIRNGSSPTLATLLASLCSADAAHGNVNMGRHNAVTLYASPTHTCAWRSLLPGPTTRPGSCTILYRKRELC